MTGQTPQRCFVAYGVCFGIRSDPPDLLDELFETDLRSHFPFGCRRAPPGRHDVAASYELRATPSGLTARTYRLLVDDELLVETVHRRFAARALGSHAELLIAERSSEYLFVHAGVVGWRGRAVLLPGRTFSGKTTLVRALLEAGAIYYSDEYALLDREGRVHPYPRPLGVRGVPGGVWRRTTVDEIGATPGANPLPVGLVLVTSYRAGARWRPRRLTAGQALLALMAHTVGARGDPSRSMPVLRAAVAGAAALAGRRGEASSLAEEMLQATSSVLPGAGARNRAVGAVSPGPWPRHLA